MDTEQLLNAIKQDNEQTRRHFDDKAAEIGRHFDVVAESLKSEIRVIAEGHGVLVEKIDRLETKVDGLDHKLENFIVETRANFEEVRAAIKFSYAELDRRVAHLESFVLDLSTRMQRLEARETA